MASFIMPPYKVEDRRIFAEDKEKRLKFSAILHPGELATMDMVRETSDFVVRACNSYEDLCLSSLLAEKYVSLHIESIKKKDRANWDDLDFIRSVNSRIKYKIYI